MFIPNRIAGPSSARIIPPTGISPTIARIRRAHNALIRYWCLYWSLDGICAVVMLPLKPAALRSELPRNVIGRTCRMQAWADKSDAGMGCMSMEDMTGLVRPAEGEEAVGLG